MPAHLERQLATTVRQPVGARLAPCASFSHWRAQKHDKRSATSAKTSATRVPRGRIDRYRRFSLLLMAHGVLLLFVSTAKPYHARGTGIDPARRSPNLFAEFRRSLPSLRKACGRTDFKHYLAGSVMKGGIQT